MVQQAGEEECVLRLAFWRKLAVDLGHQVRKIGLGKETSKCESEEGDMEEDIIHLKVSTGHSTYSGLQWLWTPCRYTSTAVIHT